MKILLTNDDGVHASGIIELAMQLQKKHQVFMVGPRTEQSGISQAITFLRPLFPIELGGDAESDSHIPGYSVDGTPTDCVKLGLFELCPFKPDLVVSGINGGLNAGSNVCYSGTVAGAMAGALFGFPSISVSLEYSKAMNFRAAAELAVPIIENLMVNPWPAKTVLNINVPTVALNASADICVVPVETNPLGYEFEKGEDPKGRLYYWANNRPDPVPSDFPTDCSELKKGNITVSPITNDMNKSDCFETFKQLV